MLVQQNHSRVWIWCFVFVSSSVLFECLISLQHHEQIWLWMMIELMIWSLSSMLCIIRCQHEKWCLEKFLETEKELMMIRIHLLYLTVNLGQKQEECLMNYFSMTSKQGFRHNRHLQWGWAALKYWRRSSIVSVHKQLNWCSRHICVRRKVTLLLIKLRCSETSRVFAIEHSVTHRLVAFLELVEIKRSWTVLQNSARVSDVKQGILIVVETNLRRICEYLRCVIHS